ncbi:MAG: hypothetical protein HYU71_03890 [Bacteroidetes bacterium]|nr:hypothetical protein [Bacteroidota bacterium]
MTIPYSQLPAFLHLLEQAMRDQKPWLGFDNRIQRLSVTDLYLFTTEARARDFQEFNQQQHKDVQLLPVDHTYTYVHGAFTNALNEGISSTSVTIDPPAILEQYLIMELNNRINDFTAMMDSFDWNRFFYDPLEANIEAESYDDKVQYNRLETLVEALTAFASSSTAAREAVERLVRHYWTGEAMEVQIESVLNGSGKPFLDDSLMLEEAGHPITPEVLDMARIALANGRHWAAYNQTTYLLDKENLYFFTNKESADRFAIDNSSDWDSYRVICIQCPEDLLRQIPYENLQFILSLNNHFMNMENLKYLQDNIKYTGFGESLYPELEKNIQQKKDEFQLHFTTQVNNRPFDAILHFRKSNSSDMYFFNRYVASMERTNGEKLEQSFPINKGKGVTAKEAYNLLQGRSVKKELTNAKGETYQAWMQLDFANKDEKGNYQIKKYNENYGYDLREAVAKFPVLELDGAEKEKELLRSLEKGNVQSVSIEINGNAQQMFVEANPQYKTINVYDSGFMLKQHDDLPIVRQEQAPRKIVQQEVRKDEPQEQKTATKQSVRQTSEQKSEKALLNKKRTRNQKGVKIK